MNNSDYYSVVKTLEAKLWGIEISFSGVALSLRDKKLIVQAIAIQFSLIFDLLPSSMQLSSIRSFMGAIGNNIDVALLHQTLSLADGIIKHYPEGYCHDVILTYEDFKRSIKRDNGLMWLVSPVKEIIVEYLQEPTFLNFKLLNTWYNCLARVNLKDVDFSTIEWEEYKEDENFLHTIPLDSPYIGKLKSIISDWFGSVKIDRFRPIHGPGTTAEAPNRKTATPVFKYHNMRYDQLLGYLSKVIGPVEDFVLDWDTCPLDRCSRLILVPKKIGKRRAISAEPTSLQFFQQGFRRIWYECFKEHPYLRRHIHLDDNTFSKDLAQYGSILGDFDTIDLSKASDFITVNLVKTLFRNTPWIQPLICTRSTATEYNSERIEMAKFAPMGSALCFPVETTIFAACVEMACRETHGLNHHCRYEVYGDDLVVPRSVTPRLVVILESLHFLVNHSKSFTSANLINFREACGGEYWNGRDVKPFRIPRFYATFEKGSDRNKASYLEAMCSTINIAHAYPLPYVRKYLLRVLTQELGKRTISLIPRSRDGSIGIQTDDQYLTNFQLVRRFSLTSTRKCCYQRLELKCIQILSKSDRKSKLIINQCSRHKLDDIAYHDWLVQHGYGDDASLGCERIISVSPPVTLTKYQDKMLPTDTQLRVGWIYV